MKPAALLFAAATLTGCSSQYQVELWNDTGQELNVAMIERYRGVPAGTDRPRATIAPGGWFHYELDKGRADFNRAVKLRGESSSTEIDLKGVQIYRARIALVDDKLVAEPISATDSKRRMQP